MIAKRILAMVAALSIISNNSVPVGLAHTLMNSDNEKGSQNKKVTGDNITTDEEDRDGHPTSDEDAAKASKLVVINPNNDDWVKHLKVISFVYGIDEQIYYKVSSQEFEPQKSDISDVNTKFYCSYFSLPEGDKLPQGDNYVCFYAKNVYTGEAVRISDVFHYRLDSYEPDGFGLILKQNKVKNKENNEITETYELINDRPLHDKESDIDAVYYSVGEELKTKEEICLDDRKIKLSYNSKKKYDFCLPVDDDMKGKTVYVYAFDKRGNCSKASRYINVEVDKEVPEIECIGAVNINDKKETPSLTKTYGNDEVEGHESTNFTYTGGASYLKVKVNDFNKYKCDLIINWKVKNGESNGVINANEQGRRITLSNLKAPDGITPENDVFYIPFADLELEDGDYKFTAYASGEDWQTAKESFSENFYYSGFDKSRDALSEIRPAPNNDSIIIPLDENFKPGETVNAYLKDGKDGNRLVYELTDDLGVAQYQVEIRKDDKYGKQVYFESGDLSDGKDIPADVKNASGEGTHSVTYKEPYTSFTSNEIPLEDGDGTYVAHIKVTDIEGNTQPNDFKFVVDTHAPEIVNNEYSIDPKPNYTPDGIYSSKALNISIDVKDNLPDNIKKEDIVLYIVDGKIKHEYKANLSNDRYVFTISPNVSGIAYIVVKDKAGNEKKYYFTTVDNYGEEIKEFILSEAEPEKGKEVKLFVNESLPTFDINAEGGSQNKFPLDGTGTEVQFFGDSPDNEYKFVLKDQFGLKDHTIEIKKDNKDGVKVEGHEHSDSYSGVVNEKEFTIHVNDLETGKYCVDGKVVNIAGAVNSKSQEFYVDKAAPEIKSFKGIYGSEYKTVDAKTVRDRKIISDLTDALNYRKYGIFGNQKISIAISVKDNDNGCGINGAVLEWGNNTYKGDYNIENGLCFFYDLDVTQTGVHTGVPKITVTDNLGNQNTYYFTANSFDRNIGELIIENPETADKRVSLTLENYVADVSIDVCDEVAYIEGEKNKWYKGNNEGKVTYKVSAQDKGVFRTGLKEVNVYTVSNKEAIHKEKSYTDADGKKVDFQDVRFTNGVAEYSYDVNVGAEYNLIAEVVDNAGNKSYDTVTFFVDNIAPEIKEFTINGESEEAPFVQNDTYGYFFKEEATVRVCVEDQGNSSGIRSVKIYTKNADGNEEDWSVNGSDLEKVGDRYYTTFKIPKGFKGHIGAQVIDNVGHESELLGPNGTVIEDDQLHSEHASITITPLGTPVNGLYNHELALNVTVKDTMSGISNIDWSIGKDNKSGHLSTSIDNTTLVSDQPVDEKIVSTDANLVTEVSFQLLVETDDLDNPVEITMTDNAGNTLKTLEAYSLDLTAPTVSTSLGNNEAKNGFYYDKDQQVNLSIVEKNFNGSDAKVLVNGVEQSVSWSGEGDKHNAVVNLNKDGEYTVKLEYSDMAGNKGSYDPGQHFIIDKTKPVITNNFADFKTGTPDEISGSTELYYNNQDDRKAAFEINVTEKNFVEEDLNIRVFSKSAGSSHKENEEEEWFETHPEYTWTHNTAKDSHRLTFDLKEDGVYKIEINPEDRAGNGCEIAEGSDSKTDIFEVDTTAPVLGSRNDGDYSELTEDKYNALAVYDINRFEEEAPYVEFTDTNLYRLEYEMTTFKPTYSGGREIGKILPDEKKSDEKYSAFEKDKAIDISKSEKALEQDVIRYTVPDFDEDGVYSVKLYAVDMAGNRSEVSDNTYVRMMNTSMLAYIENSSKVNGTGWYSFEDEEYGPISKQPTSFDDLDIVMFSKAGTAPKLLLVDKDTEAETDTHATAVGENIVEDKLYMVNATKYELSGEYFATNFTEDTDTRLYLRAENDGDYVDLGEMYIDNTKPECAVPDYLSNWGWLRGSGEKTITFSNISEILDEKETVVYINGQEVTADGLQATVDGKKVVASYDAKVDKLSVTLPSGTYSIGAKLVDKAGNMRIISEVEHFSVGNTRIWLGAAAATMLIVTVGGVTIVARKRRRFSNK